MRALLLNVVKLETMRTYKHVWRYIPERDSQLNHSITSEYSIITNKENTLQVQIEIQDLTSVL